jgi:hypothetical protein
MTCESYDLGMAIYGVGTCPVDVDALACLVSRKSGELVFFCPLCGLAFREPPPPTELNCVLRLDELAPTGVVPASREQVEAAGLVDAVELDETFVGWVEEVLWTRPAPGETEEEGTKNHLDRWYRGDRT